MSSRSCCCCCLARYAICARPLLETPVPENYRKHGKPRVNRRARRLLARAERHAQKSAEADAAAALRRAVEGVVWKPRQEARNCDGALEPRQRHPGALVRAGAEGQMPVWRAADIEVFRICKLA